MKVTEINWRSDALQIGLIYSKQCIPCAQLDWFNRHRPTICSGLYMRISQTPIQWEMCWPVNGCLGQLYEIAHCQGEIGYQTRWVELIWCSEKVNSHRSQSTQTLPSKSYFVPNGYKSSSLATEIPAQILSYWIFTACEPNLDSESITFTTS